MVFLFKFSQPGRGMILYDILCWYLVHSQFVLRWPAPPKRGHCLLFWRCQSPSLVWQERRWYPPMLEIRWKREREMEWRGMGTHLWSTFIIAGGPVTPRLLPISNNMCSGPKSNHLWWSHGPRKGFHLNFSQQENILSRLKCALVLFVCILYCGQNVAICTNWIILENVGIYFLAGTNSWYPGIFNFFWSQLCGKESSSFPFSAHQRILAAVQGVS